jgi:hypothetical protein
MSSLSSNRVVLPSLSVYDSRQLLRRKTISMHLSLCFFLTWDSTSTDYKHEFDTLDGKKICIFEHHFGRSSFYSDSDSYEKNFQQKASFLDILQEASCIQNALLTTSKSTILERIRRKESSKEDHAVAIFGDFLCD